MISLLSIVTSLLFLQPAYHSISVRAANKSMKASVLLRMKFKKDVNGKGGMGGCSGTYIEPKKIITAAHCFQGNLDNVWAKDANGHFGYQVKLLYKDDGHDLALLEAPYDHKYVNIGDIPKRGDNIISIGSPLQFEFVISEGIVAAVGVFLHEKDSIGNKANYFLTTAMINPGSSGGGVFNDVGELIGVNVRMVGVFGWNGISMAVSTTDIERFLQRP